MKTYPKGCGLEIPFFGARYPDGRCYDGYMWDLDACDGNLLISGGDYACPRCNTREYVGDIYTTTSGNARQRRRVRRLQIARELDNLKQRGYL